MTQNRVHVTLFNLPSDAHVANEEHFDFAAGDACDLKEYADDAFDLVHSNSVIEHVGNWDRMSAFAREARRVAPALYVQTPYFWFPVEPHYVTPLFHWLPFPWQVSLIRRFALGNRGRGKDLADSVVKTENAPRLLDRRMFQWLFPDCQIRFEWFLGFPKSMMAIRRSRAAAGARGTDH